MKFTILIINIVSIFLMIHTAYSQESMIYADYLSTDEFNNIEYFSFDVFLYCRVEDLDLVLI